MLYIPPHVIAQILSHAVMIRLSLAKNFGLNNSQFLALTLVGTTGGISINDMKNKLSIPGSTLTSIVDSLESKKLIKRQRSRVDRRQWLLSLSAKGKRLYAEALKAENEAMSPALEKLSESERAAFIKLAEGLNLSRN